MKLTCPTGCTMHKSCTNAQRKLPPARVEARSLLVGIELGYRGFLDTNMFNWLANQCCFSFNFIVATNISIADKLKTISSFRVI